MKYIHTHIYLLTFGICFNKSNYIYNKSVILQKIHLGTLQLKKSIIGMRMIPI